MRKTIPIENLIKYANENYNRAEGVQTTVYQILQTVNIPCKMYAVQESDGSLKTVIQLEEK